MYKILLPSLLFIFIGCAENADKKNKSATGEIKTVVTPDYELVFPETQEGLLVLFPCLPCNAQNTKTEFNIVDVAVKNNIAVLMMNFNQHLWLEKGEEIRLEEIILEAIKGNKLNPNNTFIGGFSAGGNVSLLLTNYLKATHSEINPKGLFIVDSPIDLFALYQVANKNIARNFSEMAVKESTWIVNTLDAKFGIGDSSLTHYEAYSPYIAQTHFLGNVAQLHNTKLRLYSEPDIAWWRENRQNEYEDMNAFYIEQLAADLSTQFGNDAVEYIKTENRGYRASGERHPHSWQIVDAQELITWMLQP